MKKPLTLLMQLISFIRKTYSTLRAIDESPIRIEEIDVNRKQVLIRSQGASTVIKLTLIDTIGDPTIVAHLLPSQACWLGYYAGFAYSKSELMEENLLSKKKNQAFFLSLVKGRYKIVSQDRKGYITFLDTKTKEVYTKKPVNIAQSPDIIRQFDPTQACYIGILAGINQIKNEMYNVPISHSKPILRVIK